MGNQCSLAQADQPSTIVLGLQELEKTAAAKLALHLQQNRSCLMVATDVYRPAAIDQLVTLGKQIQVPVFELGSDADPVEIADREWSRAGQRVLILLSILLGGFRLTKT